jgi:hypothetical protein
MFSKTVIYGITTGVSILSLFGLYWYHTRKPKMIKSAKKEIVLSPDETYIQKWKNRFLQSFTSVLDTENNVEKWNTNIQPIFYLFDEYKTEVERSENTLEKQWKTKVLFENTPRGNIVMFYDAYKRGFAYYSDVFIPYEVLNACAIRYVLTFFCRDFFIDERFWPDNVRSPFLRVHLLDDSSTKKKQKDTKFDVAKGPFAKLKSTPAQKGVAIPVRKPTSVLPKKEIIQNKIIHLGKIANFSFTKDQPVQSQCKDQCKDHCKDHGEINYRDFMAWRSPYANNAPNSLFGE